MKKNNQRTKSFVVASFLAIALVATPFVGYADDGNYKKDGDYKAKVEQRVYVGKKDKSNNSIWNRIFGGFFNRAKAAPQNVRTNIRTTSQTPSISGITAPTFLRTGQTGTWTVNASDPQNGSLSYKVDWGDSANNDTAGRMATESFVQTSTFTHAYAQAGKYTVKFTVSNESGKSTSSTTTVHVAGKPVATSPVISDVSVNSDRPHRAVITWKTDTYSNSSVWYGKTAEINTDVNANITTRARVLNHKIVLTGLEANTKYYVVVGSTNRGGSTLSAETSFTTKAVVDEDAPVILKLDAPKEIIVEEEATVTIDAYDPNNDSLSYSADWGDDALMTNTALMAKRGPIYVQTSTFSHIYTEVGTYKATFKAKNSLGKETSSSVVITVTPKAQ